MAPPHLLLPAAAHSCGSRTGNLWLSCRTPCCRVARRLRAYLCSKKENPVGPVNAQFLALKVPKPQTTGCWKNLLEMDLSPIFKVFLQHLLLATAGWQGTLALILHNPFDAFITPGVGTHSSSASPSNSTPKLTHLAEQVDHTPKSARHLFQW